MEDHFRQFNGEIIWDDVCNCLFPTAPPPCYHFQPSVTQMIILLFYYVREIKGNGRVLILGSLPHFVNQRMAGGICTTGTLWWSESWALYRKQHTTSDKNHGLFQGQPGEDLRYFSLRFCTNCWYLLNSCEDAVILLPKWIPPCIQLRWLRGTDHNPFLLCDEATWTAFQELTPVVIDTDT